LVDSVGVQVRCHKKKVKNSPEMEKVFRFTLGDRVPAGNVPWPRGGLRIIDDQGN
jgi:hypothetical protein